ISYGNATNMLLSNDGKYILFSCFGYHYINEENNYTYFLGMRNLDNNNVLQIEKGNNSYSHHSLAFSNDSRYLTATLGNLYTLCWDIELQKMKYTIKSHFLKNTKFSIDDRFLIATIEKKDNSIIKFFLAETGVEADSIYLASKSHYGLIAVSSDSINIAIAGNDGRLRIFQPKIFNKQFFASFSADSTVKQSSNPVHFKDYSFYNPISWFWDFGDGNTSTEQNPLHYYTSKGIYTVKLIVSNGKIIDTLIRKDFINIHNPVIADFDVIINNDTIPFTAQFINKSKGDLLSFNWNFSYDKISSDENPAILFDKWGEYDVSLIVSDSYFFDKLLVKNKIIAYPPAIPLFKTCFEIHYPEENEKIYGLDCIETVEGDFITLANMNDKYKILMRINKNGKIIWKKNIAKGKKLTETLDSCIVVVGDSITTIKGIYVSKYDIDGNFIWDKLYNVDTMTNHTPFDIKSTIDGGFIIAAEAVSPTSVAMTSCFKIDKNGNLTMYNASYSGSYPEIIATNELNYYLITYISSIRNIRLIKIDNNGNIIWQKKYTKEGLYSSKSIKLKNDDLIIAGWSGSNSKYYHPRILKVDSLGNKIWEYVSNDYNSQYYSISSISDTLFAATGNFNNQLGVDIINNQGELVNSVRFPERNGVINSIVTTKDNDLFLTGSITPPYKLSQLYTLLLKHPYIITSVEDEQTENIANPEQPFNIFPNPTNSTATLQYKIETLTHLKIELIDFMGMRVSEIENSFKEAGEYSSLINFESLAITKGIYFIRFIANGNVFGTKVIFY
ncbi:MAG TPA: PKD domain-containing protein, partial [Candidatus Kapabacteria bacterium]|nr:PKD domain-containing protein [Candidatus Kapabacteria bacterium]